MKHLLSIFLILTFSFQGFSQKKGKKKPISKAKTTAVHEVAMAAPIIEEKIIPDTLYLDKGKKYVLLVDANPNSAQVAYSEGDENDSEEAELKRNFPKENLQIITINKYTFVRFENLQTLDITGKGESFQAFAYWSGKMNDKVQVKEGNRMATEFVSEQVGGKKESSYVINTRKYKKELALLQKNKITPKSKELMKAVLSSYSLPIGDIYDNDVPVFQQGNAKLKTIDSYILKKKGVRTYLKSIVFNSEGFPESISSYEDGKSNSKNTNNYIYKDGMLTTIEGKNVVISITYNDNKMIFSQNMGDATETNVLWLENGKILQKRYILMIDDKFSYMNNFGEDKIENNCQAYYINNKLWTKNCSGQSTVFPYVHTYTSFQNGEVLQFRKSKIEKKNERTFEKYYSETEHENQNDNYKLWGTFHLDEYNLVDTLNFKEDNIEQTIKIDYTCYD